MYCDKAAAENFSSCHERVRPRKNNGDPLCIVIRLRLKILVRVMNVFYVFDKICAGIPTVYTGGSDACEGAKFNNVASENGIFSHTVHRFLKRLDLDAGGSDACEGGKVQIDFFLWFICRPRAARPRGPPPPGPPGVGWGALVRWGEAASGLAHRNCVL